MLRGKKILITGAARGLGEDFARRAATLGAKIVVADILIDRGEAVAGSIRGEGGEAHFVSVDLASPSSIETCAERAVHHYDGLDALINNAAIATGIGGKMFDEIDIETWDRVMTVNVRGTWLMSRAAHPALKASGKGRVVNIASDTALWGAPRLLHYVSSKGAVIAMTRSLAREFGESEITVNAVAPGLTRGEATEYVPQDRHDLYETGRSLKREQLPEHVTECVLFLVSDGAQFITGQLIPVNGGFVMN